MHWPIIVFFKVLYARNPGFFESFGIFTATLILGWMSYMFVEKPFRKQRAAKKQQHNFYFFLGCVLTTVALACGSLITKSTGATCDVFHESWARSCDGRLIDKCSVDFEYSISWLHNCFAANSNKTKNRIFLIGDSHARNYLPAVKYAFPEHEVYYITMGWGCGYLPISRMTKKLSRATVLQVKCEEYVEHVTKYISGNATAGDMVFVGQKLMGHVRCDLSAKALDCRDVDIYFEQVLELADSVKMSHVPVVLMDGVFSPASIPVQLCGSPKWMVSTNLANNENRSQCEKPLNDSIAAFGTFDSKALEYANRTENLFYAPLRTGLCSADTCGQRSPGGNFIWHDNDGHITEKSSGELSSLLISKLQSQGLGRHFPELCTRHSVLCNDQFARK